ncbi:MAG TPA: sigma-70 family RNA polymerase sigma factor [Gemmatimonadales bacterium]
MDSPGVVQRDDVETSQIPRREDAAARADAARRFHDRFVELFDANFQRLYRYLDRLSGEAELAADLAQEAFLRLYRRGSLPDAPEAWLVSVAMNLLRNTKSTERRRRGLLTLNRGERSHSDPAPSPDESLASEHTRQRVRATIDRMPERERRLLLLSAEGFSYRHMAQALDLNPASVGTLLARARRSFREIYGDEPDAP